MKLPLKDSKRWRDDSAAGWPKYADVLQNHIKNHYKYSDYELWTIMISIIITVEQLMENENV